MGRLEEFAPRDEAETVLAAIAVRQHRKVADLREAFGTLTPREKALIDAAYEAGARKAFATVDHKIGPAALTVDAGQLRNLSVMHLGLLPPMSSGPEPTVLGIIRDALAQVHVYQEERP